MKCQKRFENGQKIKFPEKPEDAFNEMKQLSKGTNAYGNERTLDISGMSYEKIIKARGIQWPYSEEDAEAGIEKGCSAFIHRW